jgi:hypothetical protein
VVCARSVALRDVKERKLASDEKAKEIVAWG